MPMEKLLAIRELVTVFGEADRTVVAVDGVSFEVHRGEVFGLVGESGCGKSATCRSITRLFGGAAARIKGGSIVFEGTDLVKLSDRRMIEIRGRGIAMVFQDPMSSLNPTMRIGNQIDEAVQRHHGLPRREARAETIRLLERVGVASAARRVDAWPHEFSGGMRQRVMIAMALAGRPKLLVADEPTTALDVTIQSQILDLLKDLQRELGMGIVLITHDLGVVAEMVDRVLVMYAGRVVEDADVADIFYRPQHPYTRGLLAATPQFVDDNESDVHRRLTEITGIVPMLHDLPPGCAFAPRCPMAEAR